MRKPALGDFGGELLRVGDDLFRVFAEARIGRFLEAHRFGRDDVHQRAALRAGKRDAVEFLGELLLAQYQAAARSAQRLVRGGGNEIRVRHRARMHAAGHESRDVRHVHEEQSAHRSRDFRHAREIDDARVGAGARDNHFRFVLIAPGARVRRNRSFRFPCSRRTE